MTLFQAVLVMEESSVYQAILEKGRQQGAVNQAKRFLLLAGEPHFGPLDDRAKAALDGITNCAEVEALLVRMLSATSWHDLLGQPQP